MVVQEARLIFTVNAKEKRDADRWLKRHAKKCKMAKVSYVFTSDSGIGTSVKVKCACGKKSDVTDYGSW